VVESISQRFMFPLRQRHASHYIKPGVALVGDAAHTIHPLAGQGVNLGFADVAALSEEICRGLDRGLGLDEFSMLQRYQRQRKAQNLAMMAAMEGFKRLFAEPLPLVRMLRNDGMNKLDGLLPVKKQLIRQAMGF
jgi:2-octaprenylphenol hydroxylase